MDPGGLFEKFEDKMIKCPKCKTKYNKKYDERSNCLFSEINLYNN